MANSCGLVLNNHPIQKGFVVNADSIARQEKSCTPDVGRKEDRR